MNEPAAHRTAIIRGNLSRPVRIALEFGLLNYGESIFDYGCGRGEDIAGLKRLGFDACGWDPHHRPDDPITEADVVNLGYVVNVIPDPIERRLTLKRAWSCAKKALIVSARLNAERRTVTLSRSYNDGFITGKATFQRFFDQSELREWIDDALGVNSIALAPGVFAIFRSEEMANGFLLCRQHRRSMVVKVSQADRIYDQNREAFDRLIHFFVERGRLPTPGESPQLEHRLQGIGTVRRCWSIVEKMTNMEDWSSIVDARRTDLLVGLALLKLNRRPKLNELPQEMRWDIKALIGTYNKAISQADELLYSAGNLTCIGEWVSKAPVGKRLPTAFYVHVAGIDYLPGVLRVYEGCARWLVGDIGQANIVKLATDKPKVSYLLYPSFDSDPHPALSHAMYVRLKDLDVDSRNYAASVNPPILHRKEEFVPDDYPGRPKFLRLTKQEERLGLLAFDTRTIGNKRGWEERLEQCGLRLQGHRVVKGTNLT